MKSYFNQTERNLLINSVILESPNYRELKEILTFNKKINENNIDKIEMSKNTRNIIIYNHLEIYNLAKTEWIGLEEYNLDNLKCMLCNQPTKQIFYIKNKFNDRILNVGSTCIYHFDLKTHKGEDFKTYIKSAIRSEEEQKRKVEFFTQYPNYTLIINDITKIIESSPLLLSEQIYEKIKSYKNQIMKFNSDYLLNKISIKNLCDLEEVIRSYQNYINEYYNPWIKQNIDNIYSISNETKGELQKKGLYSIIESIMQNDGLVNIQTIRYISHPSFVKKCLPYIASLMPDIKSLELINNKVNALLNNSSQISFIPLQCDLTSFMKCFGSFLFTGEVIEIMQFIKASSISNSDDILSLCYYLEELFKTTNLTTKTRIGIKDNLQEKFKINYVNILFRVDDHTKKMYCMFPYEHNYVVLSANEFIKKIIPLSFTSRHKFAESIYQNVFSRLVGYRTFVESDDELVERLRLGKAWLPISSDETSYIY